MYNDVKAGDIPILSFLKGTDYAMYVGPELSPDQREILRNLDLTIPVIYLPEILEGPLLPGPSLENGSYKVWAGL